MKIRTFNKNDAASCAQIIKKNRYHLGNLLNAADLKKASAYNQYWVMEQDDQIVGLTGLSDLQNGIGMVTTLCVNPDFQQQGIGTKLLKYLLKKARQQSFRKVLLLTHEKNKPMMILAIKADFIPEGSLRNHFRDGKRDVIYFSYFID